MRKLRALQYPNITGFSPNDEMMFRKLVVWLEDQKIRNYAENERKSLRNISSDTWQESFNKYLNDLGIPHESFNREEILDQLLTEAIRFEYSDNVELYSNACAASVKQQRQQAPEVMAVNPLDKYDFGSEDFINGVKLLAEKLQVSNHPNHLVTLEAIAKLLKSRYSKTARDNLKHILKKGEPYPFEEVDSGFNSRDAVLLQAAKILRLVFIHDLRDLQTMINECIVAVQDITANPKTDTTLGKVGR